MPDIGRWGNIDELAEDFEDLSPYNFSNNSPTNFSDPTGLAPEGANHIASTFVDGSGRVVEHRDDGDNNVYLVDDDWKKGSSKDELIILGKEKAGVNYMPGAYYQFNNNLELDYVTWNWNDRPRASGAITPIGGAFDITGAWEALWTEIFSASGADDNAGTAIAFALVTKGKGNPKAALRALSGIKNLPIQIHHFATNKNKRWTPLMEAIAKKYGLSLNGSWNKAAMNHLGRHPNEYHSFVYNAIEKSLQSSRRK